MKRAARFFMHWITLRSFSSAVWVDQYEALRLNCEVVDLSKDAQIQALEQQLQTLRRAA